jgi:hypothetical protein
MLIFFRVFQSAEHRFKADGEDMRLGFAMQRRSLSFGEAMVYPQIFLNTACPAKAGDDTDEIDKHGYFFCKSGKTLKFHGVFCFF